MDLFFGQQLHKMRDQGLVREVQIESGKDYIEISYKPEPDKLL